MYRALSKYREAIAEILTSLCVYLCVHALVLEFFPVFSPGKLLKSSSVICLLGY